jgi:hypothetical protein
MDQQPLWLGWAREKDIKEEAKSTQESDNQGSHRKLHKPTPLVGKCLLCQEVIGIAQGRKKGQQVGPLRRNIWGKSYFLT